MHGYITSHGVDLNEYDNSNVYTREMYPKSSKDPSSRADRSGLESCQHGYREKTKAKKHNNMYDKQAKGKDIK